MFSKRIGIDLGTANSLVYVAGEGVVLNEPTVVAVAIDDNHIVAVGNEAKEMLGRTPGTIMALRPMKDGVIADYVMTEAILSYFISKVCGKTYLFKPEVMVCVPSGVTQVEKRAVLDATLSAGAKVAYLIEEPLAAAIGAKIPIALPSGNMVVDIGGGSSEAAVISLGGIVAHHSVRVGGNKIDEAITFYIKKRYNLLIGERTSEEVKIKIGSAIKLTPEIKMDVRGRDSITGLPRTVEITSTEITEAIYNTLYAIIGSVKGVLEQTPPELASDIIDKGIVMAGGTSLLQNLDKLMTNVTGVPCHVAEDPLLCTVKGTGIAIENIDLYKRSITKK
ncbi:rod shape-determining protein [Candidatus Gottesmanbacteria bacterium]|nr:rod shape-determining protein [Candidatus Gottesmanbacteria bacterium]